MPDHPTARDVPILRRALYEWCRDRGTAYYHSMILLDRQPVRPAGPPALVARELALNEAGRLAHADLWYIDTDLCDLLADAHRTMPRFAPTPPDLPSLHGLAVFATPIDVRDPRDEDGIAEFAAALGVHDPRFAEIPIQVGAVSWGPAVLPDRDDCRAGAVWMSFYAHSRMDELTVSEPDDVRRRAMADMPPMMIDNEAVVPMRPDGEPDGPWLLPDASDRTTTHGWAALLYAAFRLALQRGLGERVVERTPRPERRRTQRAGLPERDTRVCRLHRSTSQGTGTTGREYRHRWITRGHWRSQPWGPGGQLRRPTWIHQHIKGPVDAPLLGGDRVTIVDASEENYDGQP